MLSFARLVQLLTLTVWVGGLVFFAFVLAPVAFHTLPSVQLAGLIVGATLRVFDVVAMVCGWLFLGASALLFRKAPHRIRGRYEMQFLLAGVMLVATAYVHWNILPAMDHDRERAVGDIPQLSPDNTIRQHFDRLHTRSERVEGGVLLVGLAVVFLMSRERAALDSPAV